MSDRSNKNSAVSPVIGTILLVAITVVLIAIITAVVMGLADAEDGKKVGMNAQPAENNNAKLILYGGESLSELTKLEMIDQDSPYGSYVEIWNSSNAINVGVPYTAKDVAKPSEAMKVYDTKINVRGTFTDGREVILLVQPMTFYDVAPTKIGPEIFAPTVSGASDTDKREKFFSVKYKNATSPPTNCTIYYQPQGDPSKVMSEDTGEGVASTSNTIFKIQARLDPDVTYEIWGEVTIDGYPFKGPVTVYKMNDIDLYVYSIAAIPDNSYKKVVTIKYANAPIIPTGSFICYQPLGDPDNVTRIDTGERTDYKGSYATEVTLTMGVTYEVWGELIIDDKPVIGSIKTIKVNDLLIHATNPAVDPNEFSKRTLKIQYKNPPSEPTDHIIHYQPLDESEPVVSVSLGAGKDEAYTIDGNNYRNFQTVAKLKSGVKYNVWGEIVTAEGSFTGVPKLVDVVAISRDLQISVDPTNRFVYTLKVSYRYSPSAPTDVVICYQPENTPSQKQEVSTGAGVSSSVNTVLETTVKLQPGKYEFWGEIITPDGMFKTAVKKFTISQPTVSQPTVKIDTENSRVRIINATYRYAPTAPSSCIIYYQKDSEPEVPINTGSGVFGSGGESVLFSTTLTLEPGNYKVRGEIVTAEGTYSSTNLRTFTVT